MRSETRRLSYSRASFLRAALVLLVVLAPAVCGAAADVVVGSKKFTESYVLGEIAKKLLIDNGVPAVHRQGLGGTIIVWQALLHGDISMYPEYTGTISEEILKVKGAMTADAMRDALKRQGIGMTNDLGFNDGYSLVMRSDTARRLGIRKISDLRGHPELRAGPTPEFLGRQDGWRPLLTRYGLTFKDVRGIEHGLGYTALNSGQIDLKECYTTDAKIGEYHLQVLEDDLHYFPQYKAVFLYRLDTPPRAVDAIRKLEGTIDENRMIALNAAAEKSKDYTQAAMGYFADAPAAQGSHLTRLLADLPALTVQHITLVAVSLIAAIIVSIPLGIVAARPGWLSQLILGVAGVIQTIPSLALLALMIPFFGIGARTAIIALFLYSLLPIIQNTAVGLRDIPQPLRESAAALGLEPFAQLRKIYLPLASGAILAGIRTSAVINVGTATLAGLIGGGGYGEPIQSGLQLNDAATIYKGAIPAAILAILVQLGFNLLDRVLIPRGLRLPAAHD
jgi:osmoprotectant transport system permease protein